jgi:glutamyl/glutaminyl-tRNA synthetase
MLGGSVPSFAHVPLVVDAHGARLQKRTPSHTLAGLRAAGETPAAVRARLDAILSPLQGRAEARLFEIPSL